MKRIVWNLTHLFFGGVAVVMVISFCVFSYRQFMTNDRALVTVGDSFIKVELARTEVQHGRGLSGHAPLADNEGMLFLFERAAVYPFWMRGMTFPIDIIWIRDGKIVHIEPSVPLPESGKILPSYSPGVEADMVLEVKAGFAAEHGLRLGDSVYTPY